MDKIPLEQHEKKQDCILNENQKLNDRSSINNNLSKINCKEKCVDAEKLIQLESSVENLKNGMCQAIIENNVLQKEKEKIIIAEKVNKLFDTKDPLEFDTEEYFKYFYQSYICCRNTNVYKKRLAEKVLSFSNAIKSSLLSTVDKDI